MDLKQGMFEGEYMRGIEERKGMENDVILLKIYCIAFYSRHNRQTKGPRSSGDEGNEELWNNGGFLYN